MDTAFKTELIAKLKDKKLADSTIKLYIRNLEKMNGNKPLKNLNFLKDSSKIVTSLSHLKPNTVRGYFISITSILGLDKSTKPKQKIYDTYFNLMMGMNKKLKEEEHSNVKSETQEKNWVDWESVLEIYAELERKVATFGKLLTEQQYNILLQYVVLSFFVLLPPRRNEIQHLMIVKKTPTNNDTNYLVLDTNKLIFNKFKTVRKDGAITIDIPPTLRRVIDLYLKYHKFKYPAVFLVNYDGTPLNKVNSITRVLNTIFGRRAGSSMLRHSYLSSKYGKVNEEMKEDAEMMSHSVAMAHDYIKQ